MYQGLDVRLDASGHLLEPLDLEGLLDLGEAALHAVVVGAGWQIEDVPDAERVEPIRHLPTPMDGEVVPEQADLAALGLLAELFDVLEELGHVDGLLEGLPTDNAVLRRHRQDQGVGRFVQLGHVDLDIGPPMCPFRLRHSPTGKEALVGIAELVPLRLGRHHFRSQLLLQLLELLLGVCLGPFGPTEDFLLNATLAVDLAQQRRIHLLVGELPMEEPTSVQQRESDLRQQVIGVGHPSDVLRRQEPDPVVLPIGGPTSDGHRFLRHRAAESLAGHIGEASQVGTADGGGRALEELADGLVAHVGPVVLGLHLLAKLEVDHEVDIFIGEVNGLLLHYVWLTDFAR